MSVFAVLAMYLTAGMVFTFGGLIAALAWVPGAREELRQRQVPLVAWLIVLTGMIAQWPILIIWMLVADGDE